MVDSLVIFGILFLVLIILPSIVGADTRDGNDWITHSRI